MPNTIRRRKRIRAVKRFFRIAFGTAGVLILLSAAVIALNDRFFGLDIIPSSADVLRAFGCGAEPYAETAEGEAAVYFIDVGQGDCELIRTDKYNILIDSGEDTSADEVIGYITLLGVERLDYVIATHPHSDHIGGMYEILSRFDVGLVILPKMSENTEISTVYYTKMMSVIEERGIDCEYVSSGRVFDLGDGAALEIIAPVSDDYDDMNNYSVTARFLFGETAFLFTGDIAGDAELDIIDSGADFSADVLKVAHHGSAGSSSSAFLERVRPEIAVIEVSRDNSYGHPTTAALNRLFDVGCEEIYMTSVNGNIVIISDGSTLRVETEKQEDAAA